jgi:hypothetical protein
LQRIHQAFPRQPLLRRGTAQGGRRQNRARAPKACPCGQRTE